MAARKRSLAAVLAELESLSGECQRVQREHPEWSDADQIAWYEQTMAPRIHRLRKVAPRVLWPLMVQIERDIKREVHAR